MRAKEKITMKKSIWIVLPIIIIAIVLVAVFAGQRNTLSAQIAQLESDKADLSKQITEADAAAKKAVEADLAALNEKVQEAESRIAAAETKAAEAETKVSEAEAKASIYENRVNEVAQKLDSVTAERDTLQVNSAAAAEQLTTGIRQAQTALEALVGPQEDELSQTKAALAASEEAVAQATMELQQTQEALTTAISERDDLKIALENAAAQIVDMQTVTEGLKVAKAGVRVCDAEGNVVKEYENLSELMLADLQPGESIVIVLFNAAGEEIVQYGVDYAAPAAEEPVAEEPAAEEAPAEEPVAEEAPAEVPAEEAPAEEPAAEEAPAA